MNWEQTGIERDAFQRYIDEQIYSLPGIERVEDAFTILLTGSRATGTHASQSDVDINVLCTQPVYEAVHHAALEAGIVDAKRSFFLVAPKTDWERYFGSEKGRPHFSVTSLPHVERHFREYEDVWLWIWTTARIVNDPEGQFRKIVAKYEGYPRDVLVKKIKYHWLLAAYYEVDVFPYHHFLADDELLGASTAIVNSVNELLKVFFLVDAEPFPYTEKLMRFAESTRLGSEFLPMLERATNLVVGNASRDKDAWARLKEACKLLSCSDHSADCQRLEDACAKAMIEAGVDGEWVRVDYGNIDELLLGELGPVP